MLSSPISAAALQYRPDAADRDRAFGGRQAPFRAGTLGPALSSWVKDPKTFTLLINARGELAAEKPAFRAAMKRRRCLIPADGFYEWQATGDRKRPFYVHGQSGKPLAFAGLWETWMGPNGEELETAAIVTTTANRTLKPIHERMPVIVPPEAFDFWLDGASVDATTAAALIAPAPDNLLEAYEISTAVNRTANDNPKLLEPAGAAPPEPVKPAATARPRVKRAKRMASRVPRQRLGGAARELGQQAIAIGWQLIAAPGDVLVGANEREVAP